MTHQRLDAEHLLLLPHADPDDRLRAVLAAALKASGGVPAPSRIDGPLWAASCFALDQTTAFRQAPAAAQRAVLDVAAHGLLHEAFYIEKAGIAYATRMSGLARTVEERALYALIAADEARHLAAVSAWLPDDPGPPGAFHLLLADVFAEAPPAAAVLIVQVLLEGWGLRHYADLGDTCRDPALAGVFRGVVADETRHHGSGVILCGQRPPTGDEVALTVGLLRRFLAMVAAGPLGAVGALEHVCGPMTHADRVTTLRELDGEGHAARRLNLLRGLLDLRGAAEVCGALDAAGAFTPLPLDAAASLLEAA